MVSGGTQKVGLMVALMGLEAFSSSDDSVAPWVKDFIP